MAEKRSLRLHKRSTTIRLEGPFWDMLEDIAVFRKEPLIDVISRVDTACREHGQTSGATKNLASCLRVYCLMNSS